MRNVHQDRRRYRHRWEHREIPPGVFGEHGPDHKLKGPGRPRVLPAMALWAGLLVCLRGFGSQLAVWRLISERGLWFFPRFPVTDQAVYRGNQATGGLFEQISSVLAERLQGVFSEKLAPFAEDVVCIDESTLDTMSERCPPLKATAVCSLASCLACSM